MKRLPWRALLYLVLLGYLVLDLKVFHGPLREAMRSRRDAMAAAAREHGWVALVNLEPITREQLDLAVARHLYQRGRQAEELPQKTLALIRRAALQALIDDTLVRQYADGEKFAAPPAETAAFAASWKAAFPSAGELERRAADLGLDPETLDAELSRTWSRKRWLEKRLAPAVEVTEAEAREWFAENRRAEGGGLRRGFSEPAKARVRLLRFTAEEEALAREWHGRLLAGAAADSPVAPATKQISEPVWVARGTVPEAFAEAVFAGETTGWLEPFRGEPGWILAEVLERREERPLDYEELRPEIVAHLEASRAEETFRVLMEKLRTVANWQVFQDNL